jgi:hypothetical protein
MAIEQSSVGVRARHEQPFLDDEEVVCIGVLVEA